MIESKKPATIEYSAKNFLFCVLGFCLAGFVAWFGYVQFFTKGLERLPTKVCEKTVDREMVIKVLPSARSAEEGADRHNSGDKLSFHCGVVTSSDSSLWAQAQVRPVSKEKWLSSYRGSGGGSRTAHVSLDGVEAVARLNPEATEAGVYVPCVPPVVPSYNASAAYAVITEASVGGETHATGATLRQTLTDVAYRIAEHAYKLAECKAARDFPEELPRYEDGK
ncbi:hypothetical protein ABTX60_12450 [Streptomyces sp. NPDC126510]|uniref:hypothetical protein n=1 Tax=Streptomyces sp. NPDC126510 TaxID=3155317 RepID=UPI00331832CE